MVLNHRVQNVFQGHTHMRLKVLIILKLNWSNTKGGIVEALLQKAGLTVPLIVAFSMKCETSYIVHLNEAHGYASNSPDVKQMELISQTSVSSDEIAETDTPQQNVQKIFSCPFICDFETTDEDIYLIHLSEIHGFSKQAPCVDKHKACHLCTFKCDTKRELAKHSTEVHQNQQKGDHSDNPILSVFKGE